MSDDRVSYLYQRDPSIDRRYRPRPNKKVKLLDRVAELNGDDDYDEDQIENSENQSSHANSFETNGAASAISNESFEHGATVNLRFRPTQTQSTAYQIAENTLYLETDDKTRKQFEFSHIFPGVTSQKDIYESCVRSFIDRDESLTLLTYGTSGSGKTFTTHGDAVNPGVIPRALVHLFQRYDRNVISTVPAVKLNRGNIILVDESNYAHEESLRNRLLLNGTASRKITDLFEKVYCEHDFIPVVSSREHVVIWLSFAEIYNENVYDLLTPVDVRSNKPRKNLKIISNEGNAFVKDLTTVCVRTAFEAYSVLCAGLENVNMAATNINQNSSRSHCIFIVDVISCKPPNNFSYVTYKFCDLAGSERLKKTENIGNRLKEAQRINTSLMVLGRCLESLYTNQQKKSKEKIPFRDSKLTLLLQRPLLGREKITTIVNMTPSADFLEENLQVLQFASIASKIVYKEPKQESKRRLTRFSWYMSSLTENNATKKSLETSEEMMELRYENDELHETNDKLLEELNKQRLIAAQNEQKIRVTLLEQFKEQMNDTSDIFKRRITWLEDRLKSVQEEVKYFG